MEENNFSQQNIKNKEPISNKNKMFVMAIIFVQIVLLLIVGYYFALDKVNGGWDSFGAIPYVLISVPLSIIGVIFGINFILKNKVSIFSIFLIIISIGTFPFLDRLFLSSVIVPLLTPMAQVKHNKDWQKSVSDFSVKQQLSYQQLTERFKNSQKVLVVDDQYSVLVLQDGSVVQLYKVTDIKQKDFIAWAKINLLNQEARFELPFTENTLNNNLHLLPCDVGIDGMVTAVRKQYELQEKESGFCSIIPVNIYLKGELINDKYKI